MSDYPLSHVRVVRRGHTVADTNGNKVATEIIETLQRIEGLLENLGDRVRIIEERDAWIDDLRTDTTRGILDP